MLTLEPTYKFLACFPAMKHLLFILAIWRSGRNDEVKSSKVSGKENESTLEKRKKEISKNWLSSFPFSSCAHCKGLFDVLEKLLIGRQLTPLMAGKWPPNNNDNEGNITAIEAALLKALVSRRKKYHDGPTTHKVSILCFHGKSLKCRLKRKQKEKNTCFS